MDRKRLTYFTVSFLILILLVVLLFARGTTRRSDRITLPNSDGESKNRPERPFGRSGRSFNRVTT